MAAEPLSSGSPVIRSETESHLHDDLAEGSTIRGHVEEDSGGCHCGFVSSGLCNKNQRHATDRSEFEELQSDCEAAAMCRLLSRAGHASDPGAGQKQRKPGAMVVGSFPVSKVQSRPERALYCAGPD